MLYFFYHIYNITFFLVFVYFFQNLLFEFLFIFFFFTRIMKCKKNLNIYIFFETIIHGYLFLSYWIMPKIVIKINIYRFYVYILLLKWLVGHIFVHVFLFIYKYMYVFVKNFKFIIIFNNYVWMIKCFIIK